MMTKNRGGASVPSRKADYLEYRVNDDVIAGNSAPLGSQGTTQSTVGAYYPTVQGALDDLRGALLDVNSVITNTDGVSPQGASQVDYLTISGSVISDEPEAKVLIFGLPFTFLANDTSEEVAKKIVVQAQTYITSNQYFKDITLSQDDPKKLNVEYLDFRFHPKFKSIESGLTLETEIQSPHKPGYGVWSKIGTQEVQFVGQTDAKLIHYFQRIA